MNYLKQSHARVIMLGFVLCSILLVVFSRIDILISKLFFKNGFYLTEQWWQKLLYGSTGYFLVISMTVVLGVYVFNRLSSRNICGMDGKKTLYLFLVLIIGSGLIVNVAFKDYFGRARPRDIVEFNGAKHFTPAFVISHECNKNCSFSSGHGAGAFFSLALAYAFGRRKRFFMLAMLFGSLVSFSRVASGAHFFSDSVTSFFVMLITSDVLYYWLYLRPVHEQQGVSLVHPILDTDY